MIARFLGVLMLVGPVVDASAQIIVAPSLAAPPGSVNTNLPGFKVRFVQGNTRFQLTTSAAAEALLRGTAIDPGTGNPVADNSFPGPERDRSFSVPDVINWHEQVPLVPGASGGNFTAGSNPPAPDGPIPPAIPGVTGSRDYFAMEATGFLELPAGLIRFGVNSDDGFKLTIGTGLNPLDRFSTLQVGVADFLRTFASTEATVNVVQAGIYPFRLVWFENNGASSGLEFYAFAPGQTTGARYLINDRSQTNAIKCYRDLVEPFLAPLATTIEPAPGTGNASPSPVLKVEFLERGINLNLAQVSLSVDGIALVTKTDRAKDKVTLTAQAPIFATNSTHTATLIYGDATGAISTNTWRFSVGNYIAIPPQFAVKDVDLTQLGFKLRNYQMPHARGPISAGFDGNTLSQAERALAGGYLDPATRAAYTTRAVIPGTGTDGFADVPGVINFGQAADRPAEFGNFTSAGFPQAPDEPIPGIAADRREHFVVEIRAYVRLGVGAHRFGVNCDDGFNLSVSQATGDVQGMVLAAFNGARRAADTVFDFVVEEEGYYPFRLVWWQGTGDSSCEWFSVDPGSGTKLLINDPSSPYQAYRQARSIRPHLSRQLPTPGSILVVPTAEVLAEVNFGTFDIDPRSVTLGMNGVGLAIGQAEEGARSAVVRRAGGLGDLLPGGTNTMTLVYGYSENGVFRSVTNTWSFVVGGTFGVREAGGGGTPPEGPGPLPMPYTILPPGNKVPPGGVDLIRRGFKILKVHQLDRSLDGVQTNGGRYSGAGGNANRMPRPEIQINEGYINRTNQTPFPNLANLAGFNADRTLDVPGVFDFSYKAANAGAFNPSSPMPGLPGKGSTPPGNDAGADNYAMETITYMDLRAGSYLMSVHCDGGYLLSSAPNPLDTLGTLIGYFDDAGTAGPIPTRWITFIVLEDGIYPFRLLYWKGVGTSSIEWSSVEPGSSQRALLNDLSSPVSIRTYREYIRPPRPWVRFSVYPMRAQWENVHQQSGPGPIRVALGAGQSPEWGNGPGLGPRPFADGVGAVMADLGNTPVGLLLNGVEVTPTLTRNRTDTLVQYLPNPPLRPGSTNVASLIYAGVTNSWTFVVQNYVSLSESLIPPGVGPDPSAPGFRVRVRKITNGTAGIANTLQRAEDHLRGVLAAPDVAQPGPEADGAYVIPGVINWNQERRGGDATESGRFTSFEGYPDDPIPGIGLGTTGELASANDLISAEVFTYLDLPAGYVKLGVNSDDGFRVTAATGFDTRAISLGGVLTSKLASDVPFSFYVPKAGLYPMRLVWFEGSGPASLELFSYAPNNERILVNAPDRPNAIKAYYRTAGTAPPSIALEPVPGGARITFTGRLQKSPRVGSADWRDVAEARSPLTVIASEAEAYYRTVRP